MWFSLCYGLHSCTHLGHALRLGRRGSMPSSAWGLLQDGPPIRAGALVGSPSAASLSSFCSLSQLLFKEPSVYCMKTLCSLPLSLNKLQGNWKKKNFKKEKVNDVDLRIEAVFLRSLDPFTYHLCIYWLIHSVLCWWWGEWGEGRVSARFLCWGGTLALSMPRFPCTLSWYAVNGCQESWELNIILFYWSNYINPGLGYNC